jgi:hypothetical protein
MRHFKSELFPAPLGPTTERYCPSGTEKVTSLSMGFPPRVRERLDISKMEILSFFNALAPTFTEGGIWKVEVKSSAAVQQCSK